MSYDNLSVEIQNLISYNHELKLKTLFLFIFFSLATYYLFYHKPNIEKSTALWSIMIFRIFLTAFSFFGLIFSPFIILTLDPAFSFSDLFNIFGTIYFTVLMLILFIILLDFYKWGFIIFLRMAGIKTNSEEYQKFKSWYVTYLKK
jgi:hypothetical protein